MRIFKNITNGYRKIASGIAIVAFLTLLYFALIPAGSMATSFVTAVSGDPIIGAIVKLVDYPQYNATTTGPSGAYTLNNVPYDGLTPSGSTYKVRASAAGYGSNSTYVTLNNGNPNPAMNWELYPSDPRYIPYLDDRGTTYESYVQIFNPYDFNITADITEYSLLTGLNTTETFEIPVNTLGSRYADKVAGGVDFIGTAKVENTRPQSLVQGVIRTISTGIYSIAPSRKIPAETIQYLPYLDDRGTTYDSGVQIFNPYDSPITVNITSINILNGLTVSLPPFDIPAKSFVSRYAGDIAGGAVGSNVDFIGTIKVETSLPAPVQGNLRTRSTMTSSMAPALSIPTATVQYLPYLDDRGTTYDSGVQIFNPNVVPITVTLTSSNILTGLTTTLPPFSIPAKTFGSRYAGDVAGGAVGSNVDFVGTIKIETSLPAPAQGNLRVRSSMTTSVAAAKVLE